MTELVLGSLVFLPGILKVLVLGFFIWLLARGFYRKKLYSSGIWHPNLVDISIYFVSLYVSHLIFLLLQG
ncbi:MAG TPA: DUF1656 domain-containing protein [Candidatus Ignatzschineria merdigallinarum]|uniref:DUF1656 domain-containing protein n=1 Tax=Candidatus Ignatzschineria merdigallinarum TaxID=2838621 RepID=A0A9D1TUD2_9GAMM|nr:DUF1656 domain-containing protein [Candidatus Ignatzschineria merdigallinarum]